MAARMNVMESVLLERRALWVDSGEVCLLLLESKTFVRASIDEALKLERAMSQLRTPKRIIVLHYSPIAATIQGEAQEIYPFLGTSRLAEVVDRHGADLVLHGHAHNGCCDGHTPGGIPVHNVAITLLQRGNPSAVYRVFDV